MVSSFASPPLLSEKVLLSAEFASPAFKGRLVVRIKTSDGRVSNYNEVPGMRLQPFVLILLKHREFFLQYLLFSHGILDDQIIPTSPYYNIIIAMQVNSYGKAKKT